MAAQVMELLNPSTHHRVSILEAMVRPEVEEVDHLEVEEMVRPEVEEVGHPEAEEADRLEEEIISAVHCVIETIVLLGAKISTVSIGLMAISQNSQTGAIG